MGLRKMRFAVQVCWRAARAEARLKTLSTVREGESEINTYVISSFCTEAVQTDDGPAFWICLASSLILLSLLLLLSTMTTAHYP